MNRKKNRECHPHTHTHTSTMDNFVGKKINKIFHLENDINISFYNGQ